MPIPLIPIAIKGAPIVASLIGKLFGGGHGDDWVDDMEDQITGQFLNPVVGEMYPTFNLNLPYWEVATAIGTKTAEQAAIGPRRATELINQGDQIIRQACAEFAAGGYPCQPAPPGSKSSGAGRDIKPYWDKIRARLVQISQSPEKKTGVGTGLLASFLPSVPGKFPLVPAVVLGGGAILLVLLLVGLKKQK